MPNHQSQITNHNILTHTIASQLENRIFANFNFRIEMSKTQAKSKEPVASTKIPSSGNTDFGQTGKFVRENQKSLIFIVGAIVVMILLYLGYQKLYLAPRDETANS